jgi:hypothetical protein
MYGRSAALSGRNLYSRRADGAAHFEVAIVAPA